MLRLRDASSKSRKLCLKLRKALRSARLRSNGRTSQLSSETRHKTSKPSNNPSVSGALPFLISERRFRPLTSVNHETPPSAQFPASRGTPEARLCRKPVSREKRRHISRSYHAGVELGFANPVPQHRAIFWSKSDPTEQARGGRAPKAHGLLRAGERYRVGRHRRAQATSDLQDIDRPVGTHHLQSWPQNIQRADTCLVATITRS